MRVLPLFIAITILAQSWQGVAQNNQEDLSLRDSFDRITNDWLGKSEELKTYAGVKQYCLVSEVRSDIDNTIKDIHHYDSLILSRLDDPYTYLAVNKKEEKKTYKDLYEMELEYSYQGFNKTMKSICSYRKDIEKNASKLKKGLTYDSEVMMLELEVGKYLNHIDKLAMRIDDHLHLIDLETQSD